MFREGIPSAVAGFQGALHLHTKIPLKSKNKNKNKKIKNLITIYSNDKLRKKVKYINR